MNFTINESVLPKYVLFAFLLAVPAVVFAQHKPNAPAPAPHASAPAHTSAPSHSSENTQHPTTSHTTTMSHTTTAGHGTAVAGHGTAVAGHGTAVAGHGTTTAGHGTTTAGHGTTTAGHGTMTAGHGTTTAGHGTTNTGHGTITGGRGTTAGGHTNISHTAPGRQVSLRGGGSAHIRPNGQIRSINRNGMHIEHNLHGGRTIVRATSRRRLAQQGQAVGPGYGRHFSPAGEDTRD